MNKLKLHFENIKFWSEEHEALLSALMLILGFILDSLTLRRVDFLLDNLFSVFYLLCVGGSIIIINLYEAGRLRNKLVESIYEFLPFLMQFSFGGLFSAFVVFYSKSASFLTNGVFVFILLALLIGNEFLKKKYLKLVFQISIYFVALFSFSIYFLPVLIKHMGAWVFIGSGAISLILISLFIYFIWKAVPERYKEGDQFLIPIIIGLYILINILYFTNIIPPIPLSLKDADVYHSIEKQSNGNYQVAGEANTWREKLGLGQTIHLSSDESAYVFSSVFAPTDLNTKIVHDWQYFDEKTGKWISSTKIDFPIKGGRGEGYRAFSKKEYIFTGKWQVDIETERGQVIGRVRFDMEIGTPAVQLETKSI